MREGGRGERCAGLGVTHGAHPGELGGADRGGLEEAEEERHLPEAVAVGQLVPLRAGQGGGSGQLRAYHARGTMGVRRGPPGSVRRWCKPPTLPGHGGAHQADLPLPLRPPEVRVARAARRRLRVALRLPATRDPDGAARLVGGPVQEVARAPAGLAEPGALAAEGEAVVAARHGLHLVERHGGGRDWEGDGAVAARGELFRRVGGAARRGVRAALAPGAGAVAEGGGGGRGGPGVGGGGGAWAVAVGTRGGDLGREARRRHAAAAFFPGELGQAVAPCRGVRQRGRRRRGGASDRGGGGGPGVPAARAGRLPRGLLRRLLLPRGAARRGRIHHHVDLLQRGSGHPLGLAPDPSVPEPRGAAAWARVGPARRLP